MRKRIRLLIVFLFIVANHLIDGGPFDLLESGVVAQARAAQQVPQPEVPTTQVLLTPGTPLGSITCPVALTQLCTSGISGSASPNIQGSTFYAYWVVPTATIGGVVTQGLMSGPFTVNNGQATLGGINNIAVNWSSIPGATYDLLRTTTTTPPATCTCLVAGGLTTNSFTDNVASPTAYIVNTSASQIPLLITNLSNITNNTGGGGTGGGGGGTGGGTGSAGGNCSSPLVLPGMVCAGPIPLSSGLNPSFQVGFANNGGTSTASPATISGGPLTSNATIAIFTAINGGAGPQAAPDGTWTLLDNNTSGTGYETYFKNITSNSTLNLSSTFTPNINTVWKDFLLFFGGTLTSSPHQATSNSLTCGTNQNCATLSITTAANNAIVLFGNSNSNSGFALSNATVTDSLGDTWVKVASTTTPTSGTGTSGMAWVDQFGTAGTHVLTITSSQNFVIIGGCCRAIEIAGNTSYYTGAGGPPSFRYLVPSDLAAAGITPGLVGFKQVTLSSNVTVNNTDTTVQTLTIVAPASGCPCIAQISYSGWANFAGVTNEPDFDFWVSDGTNKFLPFTSGQSNASTGATTTISASGYSVNTTGNVRILYANNSSTTFTLHGIVSSANAGTQTFSYQAAQPTGGSGANSFFSVALIPAQ